MKKYRYDVIDLDCANCAKKIEDKIAKTEGYKNVIAVRGEDVDSELGKDLKAAVESEEFFNAITEDGSEFKSFDRPDWWTAKYGDK